MIWTRYKSFQLNYTRFIERSLITRCIPFVIFWLIPFSIYTVVNQQNTILFDQNLPIAARSGQDQREKAWSSSRCYHLIFRLWFRTLYQVRFYDIKNLILIGSRFTVNLAVSVPWWFLIFAIIFHVQNKFSIICRRSKLCRHVQRTEWKSDRCGRTHLAVIAQHIFDLRILNASVCTRHNHLYLELFAPLYWKTRSYVMKIPWNFSLYPGDDPLRWCRHLMVWHHE